MCALKPSEKGKMLKRIGLSVQRTKSPDLASCGRGKLQKRQTGSQVRTVAHRLRLLHHAAYCKNSAYSVTLKGARMIVFNASVKVVCVISTCRALPGALCDHLLGPLMLQRWPRPVSFPCSSFNASDCACSVGLTTAIVSVVPSDESAAATSKGAKSPVS